MLSKWIWFILNFIACVSSTPQESETKAFLELIELDYEDVCNSTASIQWSFITSPSNETLLAWELQQHKYAQFKKVQKNEILNATAFNVKKYLDYFVQYKYDTIEKPGDTLLKDEDWMKLVHFAGTAELQQSSTSYVNESQNYSREDVEYVLSHNGKLEDKQITWSAWYQKLTPLVVNFTDNLPLIIEAAKENDARSVEEYWEILSGYPDGYNKLENEWIRINSLHKKILRFIGANLSQKYNITIDDSLPAYLLGSLQGYDWTNLAPDVLPYSNLFYNIKKNLWSQKYVGKSLYKTASSLGSTLLKQVPQAEFWEKSEFNRECPSTLLNFCRDGTMRVSTCSKAGISNFLTAHKDVGKILFNQMSVESTPVLNTVNRYSGLEEGISSLFGIISASPAWLNRTHLINGTNNDEQHLIVSLMMTALDVLPQLSYYYAADMWRINAINQNISNPTNLILSWWKYRQEYEGISSMDTNVPSFLDDSYILNNKPYLSKILGIILAFQLYEYTLDSTEVRYNGIDSKLINGNIIKMIQHGGAHDWPNILNKFMDIDDISADALLSYFTPLEEFIEEHEETYEYSSGVTEEKELEELEKHILQEINVPPTTPCVTSTTNIEITTITTLWLSKITNSTNEMQANIKKSLESKSSVYVREDKSNSPNLLESNLSSKTPFQDKTLTFDTLGDNGISEPKMNINNTIWTISATVTAIIIICIIVIYAKRRCRKTPKNRR